MLVIFAFRACFGFDWSHVKAVCYSDIVHVSDFQFLSFFHILELHKTDTTEEGEKNYNQNGHKL